MEQAGNSIKNATIKHAQTMGMIEGTRQKLKSNIAINISADQLQWDQKVNIAEMGHNITYKVSLKCAPTDTFYGGTP